MIAATGPDGPVAGGVPITAAGVQALRKLQRITLGMFLISIVTTAVGLAGQSALFSGVGLAMLGSAFGCLYLTFIRSVRARVEGDEVLLNHVHENFVKAIVSTPKKCADCTSSGNCSVAEMHACEDVNA